MVRFGQRRNINGLDQVLDDKVGEGVNVDVDCLPAKHQGFYKRDPAAAERIEDHITRLRKRLDVVLDDAPNLFREIPMNTEMRLRRLLLE